MHSRSVARTHDPDDDSRRNEGTVIGGGIFAGPRDHDRWDQAVADIRNNLAGHAVVPTATGCRVFWTIAGEVGWRDLDAANGEFLVLGRHSQCDVRIDADPTVSLRHLLVTSWILDDGATVVRLLDLRTHVPLVVPGIPRPRPSIVGSGSVIASFGACIVGAVPVEAGVQLPGPDDPLWKMDRPVLREAIVPPTRRHEGERGGSVITMLPEVTHVSEIRASPRGPGAGLLTLRSTTAEASVELQQADLRRGVLIGRYERCMDQGLLAVLGTEISRVHLLLIDERDGVCAYDLCSSNGTWLDGHRIRDVRLGPGETRLVLGGGGGAEGVEMIWSE